LKRANEIRISIRTGLLRVRHHLENLINKKASLKMICPIGRFPPTGYHQNHLKKMKETIYYLIIIMIMIMIMITTIITVITMAVWVARHQLQHQD